MLLTLSSTRSAPQSIPSMRAAVTNDAPGHYGAARASSRDNESDPPISAPNPA
jgi:hypothetical protein